MSKNKFKQTEIGEIPDDWDIETLAKLTKVVTDGSHWSPREHTNVSDYRIATVKDMQENGFNLDSCKRISESDFFKLLKQNCVPKERDVLIAKDGSYLKHVFVFKDDQKIALLSSIAIIRTDENKLIPEYLKYYLKTNSIAKRVKENYVSGAVIPRIILKDFEKIQIGKPSVYEQQQIASILSSLDDKIELNRKMNKTLEEIGKALFKRWFVDFEFPNENGEPYKSSGGEMVESELGEIPKGWKVGNLSDEFEILMGQSPPGSTYNENGNGLPFYQGRTDFGERFPSRRMFCSAPTRIAKKLDTLLSVRAPVGDINQANEECCIGRGVASIRKENHPTYTFYKLLYLKNIFLAYDKEGTVFGSINKTDLSKIKIILPPNLLVTMFEKELGIIDKQIFSNTTQIENLTNMRNSLLPRLMSGKIRV